MSSLAFPSYFLVFSVTSALAGQSEIRATPRENVTLQCLSPRNAAIIVLEWSRSDLKSGEYVFFYRNDRSYEKYQHPSFRGRVELRDPQMKEGDGSVILKNVTVSDSGTYVCRITISNTECFNNTISLKFNEAGGAAGHTWVDGRGNVMFALVACLAAFLVLCFVGLMVFRKSKAQPSRQGFHFIHSSEKGGEQTQV